MENKYIWLLDTIMNAALPAKLGGNYFACNSKIQILSHTFLSVWHNVKRLRDEKVK